MRTQALLAALLALTASTTSRGQSLTQTDLVAGQLARIEVTGAAPGDPVAFLLSYAGVGSGPCFPSASICLDLLSPFSILAILPADAQGEASIGGLVPADVPLIPVHTQAVVLGAGGTSKTNAISASFLPLSSLSDDFEAGALDESWSSLHPEHTLIGFEEGDLRLQPAWGGPAVTWFQDGEGPMLYKNVTGDFQVSAVVRAFRASAPDQPPLPEFRMGGLIARDPSSTPGNHDFVHVAVGAGDLAHPVAVEDKVTTASNSDYVLHPIASLHAEIRMVRSGSLFSLYHRDLGAGSWQLLRAHDHPGMPATVQVGVMVYSWPADPDVALRIERVDFAP